MCTQWRARTFQSGPLCDHKKCPLRRAVRIRNVMWSLRLKGCLKLTSAVKVTRERPLDLTAMPFLRAQMSRGWAETARVL